MSERDDQIRHGIPLADPHALEKWRDAVERQEREFAEARRKDEREQRRAVKATDVTQLRAELEARWAKQAEDRRQELTTIAEVMFEELDKLVDRFEEHSERTRTELMDAVEARFTALEMQLRTLESRAKGQFQFSREKNDTDDLLPNPLLPRRH
jgi:hypothetical protein